jgi:hypothetical protein
LDALGSTAAYLLLWAWEFYVANAPVILGLAVIAAAGRALQVGPLKSWPKPAYIAFEIAVEAVRLLIVVVVVGLGDLGAGAQKFGAFFAGGEQHAALGRLATGWAHHWPETLAALGAFVSIAVILNVVVFAVSPLVPARLLAGAAGMHGIDEARSRIAVVLFIKNLTIIPFTVIWVWGLLLYLSR